MRTLAPVRVRIPDDYLGGPDYTAACRCCAEYTYGDWATCMTWALGHLSLKHPQWPQAFGREPDGYPYNFDGTPFFDPAESVGFYRAALADLDNRNEE